MSRKSPTLLVAIAVIALGLFFLSDSPTSGQRMAAAAASRWEYKTLARGGFQEQDLNALGNQGWELVTTIAEQAPNVGHTAIFKRPKP